MTDLRARLAEWVVENLTVPDVLTFDAEDVADRLAVLVGEETSKLRVELLRGDGVSAAESELAAPYTEYLTFEVVGPWGSSSAESAEDARRLVAEERGAWCHQGREEEIYAQWQVARIWADDSRWESGPQPLGGEQPDPSSQMPPWMAEVTAQRDRATWTEATRWSAALGCGDNISEPAISLEDFQDIWGTTEAAALEHQDCPVWCDACDWWERKHSCDSCHGSGTTMPHHSDCGACGGDGTDHVEYSLTGTPITELRADRDRLRQSYGRTCHEVEQRLGKALGYPAMGQELFEDGRPNGDVCVGDHVPETLAAEAAERIAGLEADRGRLQAILGELWLYTDWRYTTKQLTTDQKEIWAAAVEGWGDPDVRVHADRWWLCPTCGINNRADPKSGPHKGCCWDETIVGDDPHV